MDGSGYRAGCTACRSHTARIFAVGCMDALLRPPYRAPGQEKKPSLHKEQSGQHFDQRVQTFLEVIKERKL